MANRAPKNNATDLRLLANQKDRLRSKCEPAVGAQEFAAKPLPTTIVREALPMTARRHAAVARTWTPNVGIGGPAAK